MVSRQEVIHLHESENLPQVTPRNAIFSGVKKRNNQKAPFQAEKITKAGLATGEFDELEARRPTIRVLNLTQDLITTPTPTVEDIQLIDN